MSVFIIRLHDRQHPSVSRHRLSTQADAATLLSVCSGHPSNAQVSEFCRCCSSSSSFSCNKTPTSDDDQLLQSLCNTSRLDKALCILSQTVAPALSTRTYLCLLRACHKRKLIHHVKQVYSHLVHRRVPLTGLLGESLVVSLAKCGSIKDATQILHALPCRTASSWTAIILAYVECGQGHTALQTYECMLQDQVDPDSYTFVSLFKACGSILNLELGKALHAHAHVKGFVADVFVGSSLVSMYGKCGAVSEAEDVFMGLSQRNTVSWNAMLSAYVDQDRARKALLLYRQLQEEGSGPDQLTFLITLKACSALAEAEQAMDVDRRTVKVVSLEIGRSFHKDACRKGFTSNILLGNTLVSMYGKCGIIEEAEQAFCSLAHYDVVSWNALLSAFVEQGQARKALLLYRKMQEDSTSPDHHTYVFALQACCILAEREDTMAKNGSVALQIGQALYADIKQRNLTSDIFIGTALVSMFGKSGAVMEAEEVFRALSGRSIVSWTVMLSAYVVHGQGEKALSLYDQMQKESLPEDDVIFLCILQACIDTGNLEMSKQLHFKMACAGYDQVLFATTTLLHTYVTCASIVEAQAVLDQLSRPHLTSWTACMSGFSEMGNFAASLHAFEMLQYMGIDPNDVTFCSVLSAFSHTGLVLEGILCFESMGRDYGLVTDLKHYSILVDLLGRAGDLKRVEGMLKRMEVQADITILTSLLHACYLHGHLELAEYAYSVPAV